MGSCVSVELKPATGIVFYSQGYTNSNLSSIPEKGCIFFCLKKGMKKEKSNEKGGEIYISPQCKIEEKRLEIFKTNFIWGKNMNQEGGGGKNMNFKFNIYPCTRGDIPVLG